MLIAVTLLVPFVLFVGGSYVLNYPVTLGVLYAFNVTLIYLVLWAVFNQTVKIHTQKIRVEGDRLILLRKKLYMSFPLLRVTDIEIPLADIRELSLVPTGVGYQLTVRFVHEERLFGIDIDINPLNPDNAETIRKMAGLYTDIGFDERTQKILDEFETKIPSWKGVYIISALVICFALAVFFAVSIYLGTRLG